MVRLAEQRQWHYKRAPPVISRTPEKILRSAPLSAISPYADLPVFSRRRHTTRNRVGLADSGISSRVVAATAEPEESPPSTRSPARRMQGRPRGTRLGMRGVDRAMPVRALLPAAPRPWSSERRHPPYATRHRREVILHPRRGPYALRPPPPVRAGQAVYRKPLLHRGISAGQLKRTVKQLMCAASFCRH